MLREVVESLSMGVFKERLGLVLRDMVLWVILMIGGWLEQIDSMILRFSNIPHVKFILMLLILGTLFLLGGPTSK